MFKSLSQCCLLLIILVGSFGQAVAQESGHAEQSAIRIGTYDSRAIAIAWAASKHNPVGDKMKELETARQANDTKRIAELNAWGKSHQQVLHLQGFGRVPVTDLLEPVQDQMKTIMESKKLMAITMHCDLVASGVELEDVTMDLVQLYDPSEKTLKWVKQLGDKPPVPLIDLVNLAPEK